MAFASENYDQRRPVTIYIGHHDDKRSYAVTDEVVRYFQDDYGYDMLTAPITNDTFHSKVTLALATYLDSQQDVSSTSLDTCFVQHLLSSLTPEDTLILPSSTVSQLILTTSSWIDLGSPDPLVAELSLHILNLEVQYAGFCGASNIVIPVPCTAEGHYLPQIASRYAHAVQSALKLSAFVQIHLMLPMFDDDGVEQDDRTNNLSRFARRSFKPHLLAGDGPRQDAYNAWDVWNAVRSQCKYNSRLFVTLTIPRHLPSLSLQSRWYSEPLRLMHIPGDSFSQNTHEDITLTQQQKQFVQRYMRLKPSPWIILSKVGDLIIPECLAEISPLHEAESMQRGNLSNPTPAEASRTPSCANQKRGQVGVHLKYMRQLQQNLPPNSPIETFGAGFQDYLQSPLQPLSDNLESITYEVFEKDPVKYDLYERAMCLALQEWKSLGLQTSGVDGKLVLAVVGAGRGPLVERALRASKSAAVEIDLWAVEKNPNAFVLLQRHNVQRWNGKVNVVQSDMRSWSGPFSSAETRSPTLHQQDGLNNNRLPIDILVSELLGSFGDNELAPECIDGVQRLLNPYHGISIPRSYSAHLTPISAPKLHADILVRTAAGDTEANQVPYVVMLQAIDLLSTTFTLRRPNAVEQHADVSSTQPEPCIAMAWEFSHPLILPQMRAMANKASPAWNDHNRRFAQLSFHCRNRGVCHGLAGYFEAVLYEGLQTPSHQTVPYGDRDGLPESKGGSDPTRTYKVELSTNPLTALEKSKDMISWFPIYFPLKVGFHRGCPNEWITHYQFGVPEIYLIAMLI